MPRCSTAPTGLPTSDIDPTLPHSFIAALFNRNHHPKEVAMRYSLALLGSLIVSNPGGYPLPGAHSARECSVVVQAPQPGDQVGDTGEVTGTAALPLEGHLWVLARRRGLAGWWPQGGGAAHLFGDTWTVLATSGKPGELGDFDIAVVVVDDQAHQSLQRWVQEARDPYPPTTFPNTLSTCPVRELWVRKSHA
jgi:hypothetical protein